MFDYGERSSSLDAIPAYMTTDSWLCRPDCVSRYSYGFGFEIRNRRLCQQVLEYNRRKALTGQSVQNEEPALVSRLILTHELNTSVSLLLSVRQVAHEANGIPVTLAPLEFYYQRFVPDFQASFYRCRT